MGKIITLLFPLLLCFFAPAAQYLQDRHNPKRDHNLSPAHNNLINPELNASINPKQNWSINPFKNGLINPELIEAINPQKNTGVNPIVNREFNPMFIPNLSPKYAYWKGLYLFDKDDNLVGYVTCYSQQLMMEFDKDANWKCFYIKTAKGTFNQFNLSGEWTGCFLCFDSIVGYNLFDKQSEWTGLHIK